ncbi:hypothetical protein P171DRAFT_278427 [Karstenula rhodostoma CBS 690.94]|uniref:Uncharacterized protein n=1 Tax=Karstenula rhodostoma CBS 690.94 TaxID=1392251 RepID=A0A9P4PGE3_9PLEO|nr:hypothetical protein P171DRAFT_278427 [Karstenula rhodostoma CBS 690.94]
MLFVHAPPNPYVASAPYAACKCMCAWHASSARLTLALAKVGFDQVYIRCGLRTLMAASLSIASHQRLPDQSHTHTGFSHHPITHHVSLVCTAVSGRFLSLGVSGAGGWFEERRSGTPSSEEADVWYQRKRMKADTHAQLLLHLFQLQRQLQQLRMQFLQPLGASSWTRPVTALRPTFHHVGLVILDHASQLGENVTTVGVERGRKARSGWRFVT